MEDTTMQESVETTREYAPVNHVVAERQATTAIAEDVSAEPQGGRGKAFGGIALIVLLGLAIFYGVRSRAKAEDALKRSTTEAAIPTVNVVHPTNGSAAQEV